MSGSVDSAHLAFHGADDLCPRAQALVPGCGGKVAESLSPQLAVVCTVSCGIGFEPSRVECGERVRVQVEFGFGAVCNRTSLLSV